MSSENGNGSIEIKDSLVFAQSSQGIAIRGSLLRLTRFSAVFEVYHPTLVLRTSEVLDDFKIVVRNRAIYAGRAVVQHLVDAGLMAVCEVALNENSWMDVDFSVEMVANDRLREEFNSFITEWQKVCKVLPEFKVVVADMQTFLKDLRLWLDQFELAIRSSPSENRLKLEREVAEQLGKSIVPAFDTMHERLETLSEKIDKDLRPAHQNFSKSQLHSLVLCSPFAHRTYHKPLGYAGDYEMVNMIARDPFEGSSLFAKIVNLWFLSQWPAKAHRNRLSYLAERLQAESLRTMNAGGRRARILNFACGPAVETQYFLRDSRLSDHADLTLVDFNGETIEHASHVLDNFKRQFHRETSIRFQKKSVNQVLKEGHKPITTGNGGQAEYDLIYCAGLLDYLSDRTCKQLVETFYAQLAPGGMFAFTVVDDYKPFRHMLEFVLDWHLIYRDVQGVKKLIPGRVPDDQTRIIKDHTGVNIFVELRKPSHA